MPFLKRHWPWIVLLLVPLIPLWRAVAMGEAIGPFDQIRQFAPWSGPKPAQPWDVLQADGVLQFYVWRDLVFEAWGKGQNPFWNPYELAGTPLLANSQSGAFYPLHILMGVLHIPTALAVTLLAWFHLFWAGFGIYKLVRALGGGQAGGVVAGASFALSPFMLSWTGLSSVITTVCWIPWILWAVAEMVQSGHPWRRMPLLALFVGMMFLGGHLQFVAYGGMAAALLGITLLIAQRGKLREEGVKPVGSVVALVLGAILGVGLALPQLLPVLEHSKTSHRRNIPSEEGYAAYSASAIQPFEMVGLLSPKLVGDPTQIIPNTESVGGVSSYWPQFFKRGANFAEGALGIGPVVLLLAFTLRRNRRQALAIGVVGLFGLLLALGTFLGKVLYFGLPGWSSTGSPGRAIVLFVLAACVAAGLALPDEPDREAPTKARLYGPIAGLAVVGILALWFAKVGSAGMTSPYPGTESSIIGLAIANLVLPAFLTLVATAVFGYLWLSGKIAKGWYWVPLVALLAFVQTGGLVPTGKPLDKVPGPADPFARVAIVNSQWEITTTPVSAVIPPNLAALSRIHELAGYDSLLDKGTKAMLDEINQQDSAPPANGNMMFVKMTFDAARLAEAGVTEVWSARPLPHPELKLISNEKLLKYALPGPGRVSVDGRPGKVIEETASQIVVEVEGPGRLVIRERNLGDWLCWDERQKFRREPGSRWIEFDIPEGKRKITVSRVEGKGLFGMLFAGLSLLVMVVVFLLARRAKPTTPSLDENVQ